MKSDIKKVRDMGILGALTLLGQLSIGFHSNYNVGDEIKNLASEIQEIRYDQEKYYAKKSQISEISTKLDQIEGKMNSIKISVSSIKVKLRSINQYLSAAECESTQAYNLVYEEDRWK